MEARVRTLVAKEMCVSEKEIVNITQMKQGMTNDSFLFECLGKRYIVRVPGKGSEQMINRREEATVYNALAGKNICDDVVFLNRDNGMKITVYLEGARVCDPFSEEDVRRCMEKLRGFHELGLEVEHRFDLFERMEYYESLRSGASVYGDYEEVKARVLDLRGFIEDNRGMDCLSHIDSVSDNFLFFPNSSGGEEIRLIDWEYAGMQDPHVDIAMFCVYAMYDRQWLEHLIDLYFNGACDNATRAKIYCYVAVCGLLWSNWCEYKSELGEDFGEYARCQYEYAREYCDIAQKVIEELETNSHQVKRAIIMAAGKGTRLHPVTLKTPKPLVSVNGKPMIETIIAALHKNDIREIYVVVGYLKEQFAFLEEKYDGLRLIENPWYDTCNNISSLYVAREHLEDAVILEGDQIISDPSILHREFGHSGYSCIWSEGYTKEWFLTLDKGVVVHCSTTGGADGWQLFGLSRWNAEDARRLRAHLELEFEQRQNRQIFWDNVALFCYPEDYHLGIYPIRSKQILEIDSLEELIREDPSYAELQGVVE